MNEFSMKIAIKNIFLSIIIYKQKGVDIKMVFFKYTKNPNISSIGGYREMGDPEISGQLQSNVILSDQEEIVFDNDRNYVYNISDQLFYPTHSRSINLFTKSISVSAVVNDLCKSGISIFDSVDLPRKEICRIPRDSHVFMNMKFVTDQDKNIWTNVSVLDENYSYIVEDGYLVYKNIRNNFPNLYIVDAKYKTVLTNGELDNEKIEAVKIVEKPMLMRAAASPSREQIKSDVENSSVNRVTTRKKVTGSLADAFISSNKAYDMLTANKKDKGKLPTRTKKKKTGTKDTPKINITVDENLPQYEKIITRHPDIVQNGAHFPTLTGKKNGVYQYDYTIQYDDILTASAMKQMYKNENIDVNTIPKLFNHEVKKYNRFKHPMADSILTKGYLHVFFTRPDCNFLTTDGTMLNTHVRSDPTLKYAFARNPDLIKQLVLRNGMSHDFMLYLSNRARSFSLIDDGLKYDAYGKSQNGYQIAFGRRRDGDLSKTFQIHYEEDRNLNILNLHKIWIDYASNVYSGKWYPRMEYIWGKIIDYACSVYVILTAEDFETIIYWAKYYGVFPTVVPYSALSWSATEGAVKSPSFDIVYAYSWKEDWNPLALTELNVNTFRKKDPGKHVVYIPPYKSSIASSGYTWVGAPFIETIEYNILTGDQDLTSGSKIVSKLRFKEK